MFQLLFELELKQSTLPFKSKVKKEKTDKKKDKDDSNDDIDFGSISPVPTPRTSRRAAGILLIIDIVLACASN